MLIGVFFTFKIQAVQCKALLNEIYNISSARQGKTLADKYGASGVLTKRLLFKDWQAAHLFFKDVADRHFSGFRFFLTTAALDSSTTYAPPKIEKWSGSEDYIVAGHHLEVLKHLSKLTELSMQRTAYYSTNRLLMGAFVNPSSAISLVGQKKALKGHKTYHDAYLDRDLFPYLVPHPDGSLEYHPRGVNSFLVDRFLKHHASEEKIVFYRGTDEYERIRVLALKEFHKNKKLSEKSRKTLEAAYLQDIAKTRGLYSSQSWKQTMDTHESFLAQNPSDQDFLRYIVETYEQGRDLIFMALNRSLAKNFGPVYRITFNAAYFKRNFSSTLYIGSDRSGGPELALPFTSLDEALLFAGGIEEIQEDSN